MGRPGVVEVAVGRPGVVEVGAGAGVEISETRLLRIGTFGRGRAGPLVEREQA